jgi:hypothetical protein
VSVFYDLNVRFLDTAEVWLWPEIAHPPMGKNRPDDPTGQVHVNEAPQDAYALLAGISKTELARFAIVVYDHSDPNNRTQPQ